MNGIKGFTAWVFIFAASSLANVFMTKSGDHLAYAQPRSYYESHVNLAEPERDRIQKHLAAVEDDMRRHPPAGLNEAQMSRRLALLDSLRAYRLRGVFPKNLDFPDRLIPYFIDAAGVPCAMGQLIIASGHGALAEDVRARLNNAYIAEIAAANPRLAAWGADNGITLEEAARVQPAYGAPSLTMIMRIELDHQGRLWVTGPDQNSLGGRAMGVHDSSGWKVAHAFWGGGYDFCLSGDGRAMVAAGAGGVHWPITAMAMTTPESSPGRFSESEFAACAWSPGDSVAWAGGAKGLARLRRTAADTLALTTVATPPGYSDTVLTVAQASGRVWVGTRRGLYTRDPAAPETIAGWDSAALRGNRVTGLKGKGHVVWVGLEGVSSMGGSHFSTRGIRKIQGDTLRTFLWSMSSMMMPSDTIHALAVRDSASVWLATPVGFYRWSGTMTPLKVADLPTPGMVINDMAGNADEFYAATNNGVYHFRDGTLVFIGSPVVSLRGAPQARGPRRPSGLGFHLRPDRSLPDDAVTLNGRKSGPAQAAGVYLTPPLREAPAAD